jgi:hypothetical protein
MKAFLYTFSFLAGSTVALAQTLNGIESAEFDPINHRFLVSNSNGIMEVDATGSAIGVIGGGTPQADYGMEIIDNTIFAIVGSTVKAYDLTTGALISSISITNAGFLNGMASDGVNRVWVTDFGTNQIPP